METKQIAMQTEIAVAETRRATIAEIEASGKTTADWLTQVKSSTQPAFLQFDDGEAVVVLREKEYQRLVEAADFAEMEQAVEEALEDFEQGRVYTREEVDAEMRQRFPFLAKKYEAK